MRVLITGGTGFVGSVLLSRLVDAGGFIVRAAVRRDGRDLPPGVERVAVGDLAADTAWQQALAGVDVVIHLAARVHVMNDLAADPLAAFRQVNVAGTERLARMAAANGVKRFVYISSVKVNGEGASTPYTEYAAAAPEDPYGISKWEAEQALHKVAEETVLEVVILRPPLVYGPGVKANFLSLFKVVDRGIPLPLARVRNRRSLIYLGNLVDAIVTCINHPDAAGEVFLVSDGEDVSTPALIRRIAHALDRPERLLPFPSTLMRLLGRISGKSGEIERLLGSLVVDTSKIRRVLSWKPPYTLDQGLKETADWYVSNFRSTGDEAHI